MIRENSKQTVGLGKTGLHFFAIGGNYGEKSRRDQAAGA